MKRLSVFVVVLMLAAFIFAAPKLKPGMFFRYMPESGFISYYSNDHIVKAQSMTVYVIGEVKIAGKKFYVFSYIYKEPSKRYVRASLFDPESFYDAPNPSFAKLLASGKVKVKNIDFPLYIGKKWEVMKGERAEVIGKGYYQVEEKKIEGWIIAYSGVNEREVMYSDEAGYYLWVKSEANKVKLESFGVVSKDEAIEAVKEALKEMVKFAPYSALKALETLEVLPDLKDFSEKMRKEIMESLK